MTVEEIRDIGGGRTGRAARCWPGAANPSATLIDAYAGNSGETEKSQEEQSQLQSNGLIAPTARFRSSHNDPSTTTSDKKDTGN